MLTLANGVIELDVAPEVGGRIVRFVDVKSGYDFLWRNAGVPLRREAPGASYDPNFFGGIDELLPNDIPEEIDGLVFPDHGELWTAEFQVLEQGPDRLVLETFLPVSQFRVRREIALDANSCIVKARITNEGGTARHFMWKLHPAISIAPGDEILCDAERYQRADLSATRRSEDGPWTGEKVPDFDGAMEFVYLTGLKKGSIQWKRLGKSFEVLFDLAVFPYCWLFASYGGFEGHHVAVLEPCNCVPISVSDAAKLEQCGLLQPGASLDSTYVYRGTVNED